MSDYFSKVRLRSRFEMSAADRRWLREISLREEAHLDHGLIWKLFQSNGAVRGFVFRRELLHSGELKKGQGYLIVSERRPDAGSIFVVESKPYAPRISVGEILCFDLRANPVVNRREGKKSRRHDVLMDAKKRCDNAASRTDAMYRAALDWLLRHAKKWGLEIHEKSVLMKGYRQHSFLGRDKRVSFSVLDYSGLATVVNPEELLRALTRGVGYERSYGCGLLLVRRMERSLDEFQNTRPSAASLRN
ncbi:MAG: type I-E CRISPR-associated protein Cas6/Cse3/CasE [Acidobacteriaceae bacterium]|nr:type I-E CRISPR-associated protein Cas6/Cse3/CasE [Acidobacteriaceae bacterium]